MVAQINSIIQSQIWFRPSILCTKYLATGDVLALKIMYIGSTLIKFIVFKVIVKLP